MGAGAWCREGWLQTTGGRGPWVSLHGGDLTVGKGPRGFTMAGEGDRSCLEGPWGDPG